MTVTDDSSATDQTSSGVSVQTNTYYADSDGDGYGNANSTTTGCTPPSGYVTVAGDCDDNNANVNPGAPEDCTNNIDDNCNQLVDEESTINSEGFESSWGIWVDGGNDCSRTNRVSSTGSYSINIQDNSGNASSFRTNNLALGSYSEITIDFSYYAQSMESGENFELSISINGGTSYTTVKDFVSGTDFSNNQWNHETIVINNVTLNNQTRIKFTCDASDNKDDVYIDDVVISGCSSGGGNAVNAAMPNLLVGEDAEPGLLQDVEVYPNPAETTIHLSMGESESPRVVRLLTITGQLIKKKALPESGEISFDVQALAEGMYLIKVEDKDGLVQTGRFVKH